MPLYKISGNFARELRTKPRSQLYEVLSSSAAAPGGVPLYKQRHKQVPPRKQYLCPPSTLEKSVPKANRMQALHRCRTTTSDEQCKLQLSGSPAFLKKASAADMRTHTHTHLSDVDKANNTQACMHACVACTRLMDAVYCTLLTEVHRTPVHDFGSLG